MGFGPQGPVMDFGLYCKAATWIILFIIMETKKNCFKKYEFTKKCFKNSNLNNSFPVIMVIMVIWFFQHYLNYCFENYYKYDYSRN